MTRQEEDDAGSTSSFGDSDQIETSDSYHSVAPSSDESMSKGINEYDGEHIDVDKEDPEIVVGAMFKDVEEYKLCIRMHVISKQSEFIFMKNDLMRVTAKCPMHGCPWRVHASRLQDGVTFQVKTMHDEHTCNNVKKVDSKMASKAWISKKIMDAVKGNAKKSIVDYELDMQKKYNIKVPYHRVWEARELAYEKIHGKIEDSYKQIPDLHNMLLELNPGSVVHYKLSPIYCFERTKGRNTHGDADANTQGGLVQTSSQVSGNIAESASMFFGFDSGSQ
ncbi:hypothetical protein QJS10_CPA01g01768 [Acorus calamus]|uniref:Transposase MuDR plant domain-containing protein n=1 Tax=Acorus calamus TaxID=4465 RepID=A0AAV9FLD0_ACOCL|nr:hypothetical protein QJS10_CPA01g01768 [Acorus calamus]